MTIRDMTPHERREAINVIDSIFYLVGISKDALRGAEAKLAAELRRMWRDEYTDALKEVFETIPDEFTGDAATFLEEKLLDALGAPFGASKAVRKLLRTYISEAFIGGKKEFVAKPLTTLPDRRAIEVLTRHDCFWLGRYYGEHIGPKISELTRLALNTGIGRKALAEDLKKELGGVAPEDYKYWDVVSSAALVRARSFGFISGMVEAEITEYEILAMMDERTCLICGEMDGRTFSVSDAKSRMDEVLNLSDPQAFRDAMPWQTRPAVGVSGSKLAKSGQSIPPFHGRCRCTLIAQSKTEPITKESFPKVEPEQVKSFDPDTRIAKIVAGKGGRSPAAGLPHWKYDIMFSNGATSTRRFFDDKGNAFLDVDLTDHDLHETHPYAPHSHDWLNGERGKSRKPKKWEAAVVEDLVNKIVKSGKETGTPHTKHPPVHFASAEEFIYDIEYGGETDIEYDGHAYFITGIYSAWEKTEAGDGVYGEFTDVDDMLDNFKVHTGESLREIAAKCDVVQCHSSAKLVEDDGTTEIPW